MALNLHQREAVYLTHTGRGQLTPRQTRRAAKKSKRVSLISKADLEQTR